jgi:hypothetical protein
MNFLWNLIKKSSKKDSESLGHLSICRLESFHSIKNYDKTEIEVSKTRFHFNYIINYILVLSIFLIIGLSYYLISNYVFFTKFSSLLTSRPKLLNNIIQSRISFSVFQYWMKNGLFRGVYDFQKFYPSYMPITNDYAGKFYSKTSYLHYNTQALLNPDYMSLIGTDLLNTYLIASNNNVTIMKYGIYPAIANVIIEASYLLNANLSNTRPVGSALNLNLAALGTENRIFLEGVYKYSKNVVNQLLQSFIIFSCLFSIILVILYAIFYYSFLHPEERKISSLRFISSIIVSTKGNDQEKK